MKIIIDYRELLNLVKERLGYEKIDSIQIVETDEKTDFSSYLIQITKNGVYPSVDLVAEIRKQIKGEDK